MTSSLEAEGPSSIGLFDPRRPSLAGSPAYMRLMAALPTLSIGLLPPEGEFRVRVTTWICMGFNRFKMAHKDVGGWDELPELLIAYRNDPEGVLRKHFGFNEAEAIGDVKRAREVAKGFTKPMPKPPLAPPAVTNANLEDLGF